eukprot:TRINITY_DN12640_c3_g1_i1.p1 TRINITY_DN12640_c3_g1~~TRINITY_DN12640_c3_g1_i1.p1  ORF type:complete len:494 (+),score=77.48 TRINITY_DN12640_c3_g1_i1:201-1484(+)
MAAVCKGIYEEYLKCSNAICGDNVDYVRLAKWAIERMVCLHQGRTYTYCSNLYRQQDAVQVSCNSNNENCLATMYSQMRPQVGAVAAGTVTVSTKCDNRHWVDTSGTCREAYFRAKARYEAWLQRSTTRAERDQIDNEVFSKQRDVMQRALAEYNSFKEKLVLQYAHIQSIPRAEDQVVTVSSCYEDYQLLMLDHRDTRLSFGYNDENFTTNIDTLAVGYNHSMGGARMGHRAYRRILECQKANCAANQCVVRKETCRDGVLLNPAELSYECQDSQLTSIGEMRYAIWGVAMVVVGILLICCASCFTGWAFVQRGPSSNSKVAPTNGSSGKGTPQGSLGMLASTFMGYPAPPEIPYMATHDTSSDIPAFRPQQPAGLMLQDTEAPDAPLRDHIQIPGAIPTDTAKTASSSSASKRARPPPPPRKPKA